MFCFQSGERLLQDFENITSIFPTSDRSGQVYSDGVLGKSYFNLRVQNEQFSEENGFILGDTEKRKYSFRRDSNPRSMDYEANSLPLSYLTC